MTDQALGDRGVIRILLVEDALDEALVLRAILADDLYRVTHAQDGMSGLELFRAQEFDLVITDLNLPGMDGFDLTRELKATRPEAPVVAATGYTSPGYADAAYRAGVDAVLRKPVDSSELLRTLRELLPHLHPAPKAPPKVLAIGSRPEDVVAGCGATLAFHRAQGHEVLIFVAHPGAEAEGGTAAARRAAEHLDARIILGAGGEGDDAPPARQALLTQLIRELDPDVAYVPSLGDGDPGSQEAHHAARTVLSDVPAVLAYATATATFDFHPTFFKPVERYMDQKLQALAALREGKPSRPDLAPDFARAAARWWGRLAGYTLVEPFEVLRGEGRRA